MNERAVIEVKTVNELMKGDSEIEKMISNGGIEVVEQEVGIVNVSIDKIKEFRNHPFLVSDNGELDELVKSIMEVGVLNPIILRNGKDNIYELISGHRRVAACRKAGIKDIPSRVVDVDDDTATIMMIDSNFIQRKTILPSEKARAYRMKYDAMQHRGKKLGIGDTYSEIGKINKESGKTVQRYCLLCNLNKTLMNMVDDGKLSTTAAFELSYLTAENQKNLCKYMETNDSKLSTAQARMLKDESVARTLSVENIKKIITETEIHRENSNSVIVVNEKIRAFFAESESDEVIERTIIELLTEWKNRKSK